MEPFFRRGLTNLNHLPCTSLSRSQVLPPRNRLADIVLHGFTIQHPVANIRDWARLEVHVWLMQTNMGGQVPLMNLEKIWAQVPDPPPAPKCEPEVVEHIVAARAEAEKYLEMDACDDDDISIETIMHKLNLRKSTFLSTDPYFTVSMYGLNCISTESGAKHIKDTILTCFPDKFPTSMTIQDSSDMLGDLQESRWWRFVHEGVRSIMTTLRSVVDDLLVPRCPEHANLLESTPFYLEVKKRLAFFATFKDDDGVLHGEQAAS